MMSFISTALWMFMDSIGLMIDLDQIARVK